ncbi:MAG: sigma E protease regulator RseP [Colwellia sp.]
MLDFFWLDFIRNILAFVIALGILVTVHEYGHFWVARKNGVKVLRFSVGFGRTIWRKTGSTGTEYVVALIPLGGYVKMLDDRVEDVPASEKHQTFNSKSVYQRIAIIAAGPLANFLFAIFAFYLMFLIGVPGIKPVIGSVQPQSIAQKSQLPQEAIIVSVAGKKTKNWQDVNLALIGEIGSDEIIIETKLLDSLQVSSTKIDTTNWQYAPEKMSALTSLGITPFRPKIHNEIAVITENSPAEKFGLQKGDKLIGINGEAFADSWATFTEKIKQSANQEVSLGVKRNDVDLIIKVIVGSREHKGVKTGFLGVLPKIDEWPGEYRVEIAYGVIDSFFEGVKRTWHLISLSFDMIVKLVTGDVSVKNLSGPISIAQGAGDSAGHGFVYFLSFLALISINLGIINLLPLPVLDGGHLLYYVIELITGKPVSEKTQEVGFKFGALLLIGLMAIAITNDFSRILG